MNEELKVINIEYILDYLNYLYKLKGIYRFEEIFNFVYYNINILVDFNNDSNFGVYMIDDYYIGRSKDFRKRISYHIIDSMKGGGNFNKNMKIINKLLNGDKLKLYQLSDDEGVEEEMIKSYSKFNNLTNIEFNNLLNNDININKLDIKNIKLSEYLKEYKSFKYNYYYSSVIIIKDIDIKRFQIYNINSYNISHFTSRYMNGLPKYMDNYIHDDLIVDIYSVGDIDKYNYQMIRDGYKHFNDKKSWKYLKVKYSDISKYL